jgi:hypothetical protein
MVRFKRLQNKNVTAAFGVCLIFLLRVITDKFQNGH